MKKIKPTVNFYLEDREMISMLSDEEVGKILKKAIRYQCGEKVEKCGDPTTELMWIRWKSNIDRDTEKWIKRCKTNKENGEKGGRPLEETQKNRTVFPKSDTNPTKAKKAEQEQEQEQEQEYTHKESPQDGGGVCVHPTKQEIIDYCNQKGFSLSSNTFTAEFFLGHYKDKGVSLEHTWQARLDGWIERNKAKPVHTATVSQDKPKVKKTNFSNFHERKYDYDKLEFLLTGHGGVNRDAKEAYEMLNNTVISGGLKDYQKIDLPENDGVIHEDSDDELPFP